MHAQTLAYLWEVDMGRDSKGDARGRLPQLPLRVLWYTEGAHVRSRTFRENAEQADWAMTNATRSGQVVQHQGGPHPERPPQGQDRCARLLDGTNVSLLIANVE
jgi:hypothetical protein